MMTSSSDFPGADRAAQWFQDEYPGAVLHPSVVVLHTTEGTSWPGYQGGATAPTLTVFPLIGKKKLAVRQHFPLDRSSRALRNAAGGVETNTLNAIQIELVGTCDPAHRKGWGGGSSRLAGEDYLFWPDAPDWALRELGRILAELHRLHPGIPLKSGLDWLPYPSSYGSARGQRMSGAAWRRFYGICGHQHVPENDHGDPGNLPIETVLTYARGGDAPKPAPLNRIQAVRREFQQTRRVNVSKLDAAIAAGRRGVVRQVRERIGNEIARLHHVPGAHGKNRVGSFLRLYQSTGVADIRLLDRAVAAGRTGVVKDVRDSIVRQVTAVLPKK